MVSKKKIENIKPVSSINKEYIINSVLVLIPTLLVVAYFILYIMEQNITQAINNFKIVDSKISRPILDYPEIKNPYDPYLTASSAIILEDESQVPLFEKNTNLRFSMASTTKIMTALVALDYYAEDQIITIQNDQIEGAEVGFLKDEKFKFIDVLYGMLLPSGNDAAYAIAHNYPGGLSAFVQKMNEKAVSLHLYSTHYSDPAGLDDDGNYTTAKDLARLASVALRNPKLKSIVATKDRQITSMDSASSYNLVNLNKLLGYFGINGLKTGYTQGAGGVLVTSKEENGKTYIIVVIKSDDRFVDTLNLVSYMTGNISYFTPINN